MTVDLCFLKQNEKEHISKKDYPDFRSMYQKRKEISLIKQRRTE